MEKFGFLEEQQQNFRFLLRWTIWVIPMAIVIGSGVAFFLWSLDAVTQIRLNNPWLLSLLPLGGVLIFVLYRLAGKQTEKGNNLILEEIHEPSKTVPFRMAPLVLIATLLTHLFGGSAGREGTAVQMGGSLADSLAKPFGISPEDRKILLLCGMAAGFGSVFGTPLTGAIFAVEVLFVGRILHTALIPCLLASILGDISCQWWGLGHTKYAIATGTIPALHANNIGSWASILPQVILLGIAAGLASNAFSSLTHRIKTTATALLGPTWMVPAVGGIIIILLSFIPGNDDYLGLGVWNPNPAAVTISSSFSADGAAPFSWAWKLLFTAITIGMGFKGGEVTPLFFIGATLGNSLAVLGGAPVDLMAALGFIAVFAAATNTPIACTIMGIELFGGDYLIYYAIACFTAYFFSSHKGIYSSQRSNGSKIWTVFRKNGKQA